MCYVVFEGVKGVGKTTLFWNLSRYLWSQGVNLSQVTPTKATDEFALYERVFNILPCLRKIDFLKERFYAWRSNESAKYADWQTPLLLGDRSIATSYATRLWRFGDPCKQIERVDNLEYALPAPDFIFYLDADFDTIMERISSRQNRNYGKEDELPQKILTDIQAYQFLMQERPAKRLEKTTWIKINANQKPENVFTESLEQIKFVYNI
jgi:thymidylate kinase